MPSMHARFSRWIEPVPKTPPGVAGRLVLAAIGGVFLLVLVTFPVETLSFLAAVAAVNIVLELERSRHVRLLTHQRANEDVGTFARAFDRRGRDPIDPWAIRAVWNALLPLTQSKARQIPLRPTDRIEADLRIDPDEIDFMMSELVEQCERVPGDWDANPYSCGPGTVSNLVYFISTQPLRRSAQTPPAP